LSTINPVPPCRFGEYSPIPIPLKLDQSRGRMRRRRGFQVLSVLGTALACNVSRRRDVDVEKIVLLVEDDAPLKRSLEKFLERAGYACHSCSTAREALALVEGNHYPIAIVEYHLPDANGAGLLGKLKLVRPGLATIVLSEYDFQAVADDLVRVNVGFFLKKPFDVVDLEAALSHAESQSGGIENEPGWKSEFKVEGVPASLFK